jgi:hypothetical protein
MSFKPIVRTDRSGKFYGNALAFATYEEAYANARHLAGRWTLVIDFSARESDETVTHTYVNGVLESVKVEIPKTENNETQVTKEK